MAIKKITSVFEHVSDATRILREIKLLRMLKHPGMRKCVRGIEAWDEAAPYSQAPRCVGKCGLWRSFCGCALLFEFIHFGAL